MTPVKDPSESVVLKFDFDGELASITAAIVSISIYGDGVDPDVGSMLDGALQIVGATVLQRVKGGVHGVDYKPRCVATSNDDIIVRAAVMPVRTA